MTVEMGYVYDDATKKMERFSQNDINTLREWTQQVDKSKCIPRDLTDKQIVLFYNACESDLEKSKICIEKFYQSRKNAPELFSSRSVSGKDVLESVEALEFAVLPQQSPEGYDVIFHRLHCFEPSKYHLQAGIKLLLMTVDSCQYERGPQKGVIFLFDMKGVRLAHLTRVSILVLRKFLAYVQEAMPMRMRSIHVMNAVPFFDKVLALIRPFVDKKFIDMIKLHTSNEDMEKFYSTVLPKSALPPDYGGTLPDVRSLHASCMEHLAALEPYFIAEEAQRRAAVDNKSIDKSFKKLEID